MTTIEENKTTTVAITDAERLITLAADMELRRMEIAEQRARYIALLPIATDSQFAEIQRAATDESEPAEGHRVNVDFKLSAEQAQILRDVRAERVAELTAKRDELMGAILADRENKLVSLKVRIGTKRTTTTCRFNKETGARPAGLMARLKEMTGLV